MRKNAVRLANEPSQPLLPTINLARLLTASNSAICTCGKGEGLYLGLTCEEAPWTCPRSVPPPSNTGVHGLGSAAASSDGLTPADHETEGGL